MWAIKKKEGAAKRKYTGSNPSAPGKNVKKRSLRRGSGKKKRKKVQTRQGGRSSISNVVENESTEKTRSGHGVDMGRVLKEGKTSFY